ncbi:MAG: bifunctional UDP-N-acetylglucosamine diphosphorylase/glucosamine-1-phosphate N-acetyltransferase GlmU [Christensenellales bacterium]
MKDVVAIIMAAGEGKRMKSPLPKVLHTVCGRSMLSWVKLSLKDCCEKPVVVIGHGREKIKEAMKDTVFYAVQEEQKGTGHAVMTARDFLIGQKGFTIVTAGDMPLVTTETINRLADMTETGGYAACMVTMKPENSYGYGRVLRLPSGKVGRIVEQRDANEEEKAVAEVNASVYCFRTEKLLPCLDRLSNSNSQGEYYLTDVISMLAQEKGGVGALLCENPEECIGVNDRMQLAEAAGAMRRRILRKHMAAGVTVIDPDSTYVDDTVIIGSNTAIYPGNVLEGDTVIGDNCVLYPGSYIRDSEIESGAQVYCSCLIREKAAPDSVIGPFAGKRQNSQL